MIAIIGISGRFPGARDVEGLWRLLRDGAEAITFFSSQALERAGCSPELLANPRYVKARGKLLDAERFDAALFGYRPAQAARIDPQQRLFLEASRQALVDSGFTPGSGAARTGVFAGCGPAIRSSAGGLGGRLSADRDFLATRVSFHLDLTGPSLTIQTACSTSLATVCLACQSLLNGDCDSALAGGVAIHWPQDSGYLYRPEGILSPDGHCRTFDRAAAGTVPGNGLGVVVLKRLDEALADRDPIRAIIRGWAMNNDGGGKLSFTAPRPAGQAEVIREALAFAGVKPADVSYVEAHGTATRLGDAVEIAALKQAFSGVDGKSCALGSIKTNIGHLDAASGIAGLIKTVLALERRQIPPSLHFEKPPRRLGLEDSPFFVQRTLADWPARGAATRRAGVSSFGIGGTNVHVVLEEAPDRG